MSKWILPVREARTTACNIFERFCRVRSEIAAGTHPLFGRLLAKAFKRWNGVLLLVVVPPDGFAGTIRADATDVLGPAQEAGPGCALDPAGLAELHPSPEQWPIRPAPFRSLCTLTR